MVYATRLTSVFLNTLYGVFIFVAPHTTKVNKVNRFTQQYQAFFYPLRVQHYYQ